VPSISTTSAKIWIKGYDGSSNPTDYSDTFTITGGIAPNNLSIITPNGGETLTSGSTYNIRWDGPVKYSAIDLEYYNGSKWNVLASGIADTGTYAWAVPNVSTTSAKIWIKGYDGVNNPTDYSDGTFTIKKASTGTITVTSPNGGENWGAETVQSIRWTSSGEIANVKIEYTFNAGASWTTIAASTENDGLFNWTVPNQVSNYCLIRISNAADVSLSDISNSSFYISEPVPPQIALDRTTLNFAYIRYGADPLPQSFGIANGGGQTLNWTLTPSVDWLMVNQAAGSGPANIEVTASPANLGVGDYTATIDISAPGATNTPQAVTVNLKVINASQDNPPFGDFATPIDGTADVSGSIAVTGWVLDDVGFVSVKIYRLIDGELSYIGDAVFVEGARPDVELAYPDYPMNYKAGWGYMMLTNFLPEGELILKAIARDTTGYETVLGTRTIYLNHQDAQDPLGAIDTPGQGGEASGSIYWNKGWALTPLPNKIPEDGSTIKVFIDGIPIGNGSYNTYREDIANFFPNYANSQGSAVLFSLDTTAYENGVHSIAWSVTDNAGNTDGVGSRYFNIQNASSDTNNTHSLIHAADAPILKSANPDISRLTACIKTENDLDLLMELLPDNHSLPTRIVLGYGESTLPQEIYPDETGAINIHIDQLQRMQITLGQMNGVAYQRVGNQLRPLPIGSYYDPGKGIFYWQAGAGFLGDFQLIFLGTHPESGEPMKTQVNITINPRSR